MKVTVKTLDGGVYEVEGGEEMTVGELKEALAPRTGVPAAVQRLIFKGRVLQDTATLATCALVPGCTLHLVQRPPAPPQPPPQQTSQQTPPQPQP
jgi:hypothetical protein